MRCQFPEIHGLATHQFAARPWSTGHGIRALWRRISNSFRAERPDLGGFRGRPFYGVRDMGTDASHYKPPYSLAIPFDTSRLPTYN
jgi:hypothetical protein